MTTKTIWGILAVMVCSLNSFSQEFYVNRIYQDASGSPVFNPILNQFGIQWSRTIESLSGDMITVGHTYDASQGENIFLRKTDPDGNAIFSVSWNSSGTQNDYGINVYEASGGDIYVCGTTDNGGSTDYDGVILRYSSSGTLLSSTTFPGSSNMNDIATALIIHPISGNLLIAVCNENVTTNYDYLVLQLDPLSLAPIGVPSTYDYANLIEIPLGIEIDSSTGDILVIGGSQSSAITCAYAMVILDGNTLGYISDARTDLVGSPNDQPLAYVKDAANNIYITGKTWSGTHYNIKTVKINSSYSIDWSVTLDVNGMDDIGNTIALDPTNGNVIIGGLCTRSGNVTDMMSVRYNGSTGATIGSPFRQPAENPSGSAAIKKLVTSPAGNVYFVAGEKGNSGLMQVLVGRINSNSASAWQRQIINTSQDILPSDIEWTMDGIYAISVLDSLTDSYLTTGYEETSLDTTRTYRGGRPFCKEKELLVSFLPLAMNKNTVDDAIGTGLREFGDLKDWLTSAAFAMVNNALEEYCGGCDIKAFRVYEGMKTTDTLAVSRLDQYVPVPAFWSTLLLEFPNTITIQQAQTVFGNLKSIVACSQPNNFIEYMAPPNDSLYNNQKSLHLVGGLTNAHINVEEAWTVQPNCGAKFVKGGIFDTGVNYKHKDLGYTGVITSGKIEGWMFNAQFPNGGLPIRQTTFGPMNYWDYDWLNHGTKVAGIIGALRNNTSGVAGIAGGDAAIGNTGVSLYSLNTLGPANEEMKRLIKAIRATALGDGSTPYAWKIHFANHSYKANGGWSFPDSIPIYNQQIHFANRMQVTQVASRGNYYINDNTLPATYDSCMVISVGASDANGNKMALSCYGSGMDILAPGDTSIVQSISYDGYYTKFSGTSAAAPFASGVVALLMAHVNDSVDNYYNLAPEDCDYVIRHSATDVGPAGYDSINGQGRLNAGKALRMVEKPVRALLHYGTNSKFPYTMTKGVYSNSDTVKLTESYQNYSNPPVVYPPARYVVKTYQVDATVSHIYTYPTDSFMHKWERHSSSYTYPLPDAQKRLNMHERCFFTAFSGASASLRGYVYQVWDTVGNFKGWWPCDTSFNALMGSGARPKTLMEYSVLYKNKAVGVEEHDMQKQIVSVFPNPTSNEQTLVIDNDKVSNCIVEMYDVMGRLVRMVYSGKAGIGKTTIRSPLENLPNSVYFYLVKLDEERISLKVIKTE